MPSAMNSSAVALGITQPAPRPVTSHVRVDLHRLQLGPHACWKSHISACFVRPRRYARLFALVYTVLLHFMVFTLLSRASHHHASAEQLCLRQHHMVHELEASTHHISDPIATATQQVTAAGSSGSSGVAGGTSGSAVGAVAAGVAQGAANAVAALSPWAAAAAPSLASLQP